MRVWPLLLIAVSACTADEAPRILGSSLIQSTPDAHGPYQIVAVIQDDRKITRASVLVEPRLATTVTATRTMVPMTSDDGETWIAELPSFPLGTVVGWAVVAEDGKDRRDLASDPEAPGRYFFTVGNVPSKPEVLTLWPSRGPTSGGTKVLIVGRDLREALIASFGAGDAETLELLSRTQVRVSTPRGPVGLVDVGVRNRDSGTGALIRGFEYFPAPEIFEVIPSEGPTSGGTFVRILGVRFAEGAQFFFDELLCGNIVIVSATEATCITPPHEEGFADVSIVHETLGMGTKEDAFYYVPPPEILMIVPARGTDLGGTRVRITGNHFHDGARVFFDDREAEVLSVAVQRIDAITPPHPVGFAELRVVNPDNQQDSLADAFFFFGPPEIHRIEPPYAAAEGGATVTIFGANFDENTLITADIGGLEVELTCTFVDEGTLSCVVPPEAPDAYDVTATNPDLRSDTLEDGLTYFQITAVTPVEGPESGGNAVRITGVNLPPTAQIFFGGTQASCTYISETRIDCVAPPGPGDTFVDVDVLPPDVGQVPSRLVDGYYYIPAPEVISAEPDFGPLRGGQLVTITGRYFEPGATVTLDGIACTNVVFVSSTELRCVVPANAPGLANVVVTNPDGQSGDREAYEYVPITFTPEWGLVDGFANMELRGAGFAANAQVIIGGQQALDVRFLSPQHMRARVPSAANTGPAEVRVTNPGETPEISPTAFSYRVYRDRSRFDMAGSGETSDILVLDGDGDGDNDLVFINGSVNQQGESQAVENLGGGLSWSANFMGSNDVANEGDYCDYDADGDPDLIWGVSGGDVRLFRNNGSFGFNSISLPTQPSDAFEASFHQVVGNARCDIISFSISGEDTVLHNDNGTFVVVQDAIPHDSGFIHDHKIDSADLDDDGDNDLVAVVDDVNFQSDTQRHRVYLNNGDGTFEEDLRNSTLLTSIHGDIYDVRLGDLDRDGDPDCVMPVFNDVPVILLNDGTGVFTRDLTRLPNEARGDSALFLEDIEGDGDLDLYLVDLDGPSPGSGSSALFLNDGLGFFFRAVVGEPESPPGTYRAATGDLDGDGANDIVFGVVFGSNRMDWAEE